MSTFSDEEINDICKLDSSSSTLAKKQNLCLLKKIEYILLLKKHLGDLVERHTSMEMHDRPQARGQVRDKIKTQLKLITRAMDGELINRPRRSTADYTQTRLSPITLRVIIAALDNLILLEQNNRQPKDIKRIQEFKIFVKPKLEEIIAKDEYPDQVKNKAALLIEIINKHHITGGKRRSRRRRRNYHKKTKKYQRKKTRRRRRRLKRRRRTRRKA